MAIFNSYVAVYQRVFHRETIFSPTRHGKAIAEGRGKRLHGVVVRKGENYGFIQPGDSGAEEKDNFGTLKVGAETQCGLNIG